MKHALENLKIIDLTRVLGGPYATQILADHGADVIKVEAHIGDEVRGWGPPFSNGMASYFINVNRNKRSIAIDLLSDSSKNFALYCVKGIKADRVKIKHYLENSLMLITALAPKIGYDKAAKIAKSALKNGTTLRSETLKSGLINEKEYDKIVDPKKMIYPA